NTNYFVDVVYTVGGTGSNPEPSPTPESAQLEVTDQSPAPESSGISTTTQVSMTFNHQIASSGALSVTHGESSITGSTTLSEDGTTLTFIASAPFSTDAIITVTPDQI